MFQFINNFLGIKVESDALEDVVNVALRAGMSGDVHEIAFDYDYDRLMSSRYIGAVYAGHFYRETAPFADAPDVDAGSESRQTVRRLNRTVADRVTGVTTPVARRTCKKLRSGAERRLGHAVERDAA